VKEIDFSTKSPQSGRIFRFGFSFSVWSTNNFGKIFYSLDEKLIENPVYISIELFHRTKYRWNLYKNVARLITFLTKLLVGFYDKLKNFLEYFSIPLLPLMGIPWKASFLVINMALPTRMRSKTGVGTRKSHLLYITLI
jgi:hypothetical protein